MADPTVIAVDWSGAFRQPHRKLALTEIIEGFPRVQSRDRNREETIQYLKEVHERSSNLVVGLDFAFSTPNWFVQSQSCSSGPEFWDCVGERGEEWLKHCRSPFWGRKGHKKPDGIVEYRRTEDHWKAKGFAPKSVFQVGGWGAVGTGSIRGMPFLRVLRDNGFSIWPFDPPKLPLVVEIYPRILTGDVKKRRYEDRRSYLRREFPKITAAVHSVGASTEDAFDSLVSALRMTEHLLDLRNLPSVTDAISRAEGVIWGPE